MVETAGLPAPIVTSVGRFGDRWGLVMSRAPGPAFAEAMAGRPVAPAALRAMARLQLRIHAAAGRGMPNLKARLAANIAGAELLGPRRTDLLAGLDEMPDGDRLCHGDFHPGTSSGRSTAPSSSTGSTPPAAPRRRMPAGAGS